MLLMVAVVVEARMFSQELQHLVAVVMRHMVL
jgi:hypothetical protein